VPTRLGVNPYVWWCRCAVPLRSGPGCDRCGRFIEGAVAEILAAADAKAEASR